jgi:hypothetical protein
VDYLLFLFIYLFIAILGLELSAYTMSHISSPFFVMFFQDKVSQTICQGWLQT